jgi:hypothetical protein
LTPNGLTWLPGSRPYSRIKQNWRLSLAGHILKSPEVKGFRVELQLEILDALSGITGVQLTSAKDEADRLYQQAVLELRDHVARMVK